MLSDRLSGYFDTSIRTRGRSYAIGGKVTRISLRDRKIKAIVRGSGSYKVAVELIDTERGWEILASCTCPYAEENGCRCKHIWATLLQADRAVEIAWGEPPKRVLLCEDSEEFFDTDNDEDWMEDDDNSDDSDNDDAPNSRPSLRTPPLSSPGGKDQAGNTVAFRLGDSGPTVSMPAHLAAQLSASLRPASALTEPAAAIPAKKPKVPEWQRLLANSYSNNWAYYNAAASPRSETPISESIWYIVDLDKCRYSSVLIVELARTTSRATSPQDRTAIPEKFARVPISSEDVGRIRNDDDRWICTILLGAARPGRDSSSYSEYERAAQRSALWSMDPQLLRMVLPRMAETGRLLWRADEKSPASRAAWAPDAPWELVLELSPTDKRSGREALLRPVLRRAIAAKASAPAPSLGSSTTTNGATAAAADAPAEQRIHLADVELAMDGDPGAVLHQGQIAPLHIAGGRAAKLLTWARSAVMNNSPRVDSEDVAALLDALAERKIGLPVVWPEGWGPKRITGTPPKPRLLLTTPKPETFSRKQSSLFAKVGFAYEGTLVESGAGGFISVKLADGSSAILQRHADAEAKAAARVLELGAKRDVYNYQFEVPVKALPGIAATLLAEDWEVLRDAAQFKKSGKVNIKVSSGIDWFDLEGAADFGDTSASIGAVLDALKKGEKFVKLSDGSLGFMPDEWLSKYGRWLGLGRTEGEAVRFSKAQLSLVDALMDDMPEATCDKQLTAARAKLRTFDGIKPRTEPKTFRGELRPYQRQGLGWLQFLAEFGLGGCLADDMGLGKTIQLLAHLTDRRKEGDTGPWLVVAPKSLVLNWAKEAEKFAPKLRVLDYTGGQRTALGAELATADLVLTTYATMRMDIESLRKVHFDCVVLDEAQTIKNGTSQASKAARLLVATRRLALTGTPVENRLEDLWSIFEFLNPGMLGSMAAFQEAAKGGREGDAAGMDMLRRALKPFLLRRTKATVAPELPTRSEQTVRCELEGPQRKLYEDLRTHYQSQLLGRIERDGMNKSKMQVLEALLRLRQVACHPALIEPKSLPAKKNSLDGIAAVNGNAAKVSKLSKSSKALKKQADSPAESAKVNTLVEMLEELAVEGHKALVFSQFTSLLALVKTELDKKNISYEELDGTTSAKERADRVDRFQNTPVKDGGRGVFLISLKAGGVGLNLTAAGYVFLLDPWWNPAVEAQAIDRAHRIGQDKSVIAYRLIATNTVEERILELQEQKRELAAAIVSENAGPLSSMTRDDLAWLLS